MYIGLMMLGTLKCGGAITVVKEGENRCPSPGIDQISASLIQTGSK